MKCMSHSDQASSKYGTRLTGYKMAPSTILNC